MKNKTGLQKINGIAEREPSKWIEEAGERIKNREWRMKSARIALRILNEIKARKISQEMSQKMLADKMGVSPQYVNKILKGQENLSLETICKIEKALGITLIEIPSFVDVQQRAEDIINKILDKENFKYPYVFSKKFTFPSLGGFQPAEDVLKHYFNLLKKGESENTIA